MPSALVIVLRTSIRDAALRPHCRLVRGDIIDVLPGRARPGRMVTPDHGFFLFLVTDINRRQIRRLGESLMPSGTRGRIPGDEAGLVSRATRARKYWIDLSALPLSVRKKLRRGVYKLPVAELLAMVQKKTR